MSTHQFSSFDDIVQKNVEAIGRIEQAAHDSRTRADSIADAIAAFCGSPGFVWVHCLAFGSWLVWNTWGPRGLRLDAPPFPILTLVVSLEAIFLSTFILISQNRQQRIADKRNHLDLQINMLAEQENSQMLLMLKQMMDHLGIASASQHSDALQERTDPEKLASQIESALNEVGDQSPVIEP